MKISKLFHWLYGFLMLMPVFAVLFTCLYVVFNKNAYQSYKGTALYSQVQKVNVDNFNFDIFTYQFSSRYQCEDFNFNGYYTFSNLNFNLDNTLDNCIIFYLGGESIFVNDIEYDNYDFCALVCPTPNIQQVPNLYLYNVSEFFNDSDIYLMFQTNLYYQFYDTNLGIGYINPSLTFNNSDIVSLKLPILNNSIYVSYQSANNADITLSNLKNVLNNLTYLDVIYDDTLSSVFYSSINNVSKSYLFNWANDSFLIQPLTYIGNFFGLLIDNPIYTYFSYWLSISIIWLVFDLVMYLPLLVHRWLDKGVIE